MSGTLPRAGADANAPAAPISPQPTTRDPNLLDPVAVGGKAAQLARLDRDGFDVPAWRCVPAACFAQVLGQPAVQRALHDARDVDDDEAAGALVRTAILAADLPDDVVDMIHAARAAVGAGLVAVRSSALDEDGVERSFAGQFDTVLGVDGDDAVVAAVRQCWASAFSGRVLAYRARHGVPRLEAAMSVVVQVLIDADSAGVAFSGDPVTGDPETVVVSATWGLGEALVSGAANADTYRLDRATGAVTAAVASKDVQTVLAPRGGSHEQPVPDDMRDRRTLDDDQVAQVAAVAVRAESLYGCAQDVEWAVAGGRLHVLQTRPITSPLRPRGRSRVWDNSNIVESYSGIVSPLTFSFAREVYHAVYMQFFTLLGVAGRDREQSSNTFRQLLGYVDGRVFYNMQSWYYGIRLLPGYRLNRAFMEQMMGVREQLADDDAPPSPYAARIIDGLRLVCALFLVLRSFALVGRQVPGFRSAVRETLADQAQRIDGADADELVAIYGELKSTLLWHWRVPLVNDFACMVFFGLLSSLTSRYALGEHGTLHNDLLAGQGDVESTEPTHMLLAMAERVRAEPGLADLVETTPDDTLRSALEARDDHASRLLVDDLDRYLERYGDRCVDELKLEAPTLRDDPAFLYAVLRSFIAQPELSSATLAAREHTVRERAEQVLAAALQGHPLRRRIVGFVLRQARERVRQRENLRFDRTRVFGAVRRIFVALGVRLHAAGLLDHPHDVFYLEIDEVFGIVQGTCTTLDPAALARLRRGEAERCCDAAPLPDRFTTHGPAMADPTRWMGRAAPITGDALTGTGCCPGIVTRPARVVISPAAGVRIDGDIMVCERTDPGWVPLFPSCGGLLVERGSLLSHSAIVAREFGIPAVVGIEGLMAWARDGETVTMDGSAGTVVRDAATDDHADAVAAPPGDRA